jgi:hypothetical protein
MYIDTRDAIAQLAGIDIAHSRFPFLAEAVVAIERRRQTPGGMALGIATALVAAQNQRRSDLAEAGASYFAQGEAQGRLEQPRIHADIDVLGRAYDALHLEEKGFDALAALETGLALAYSITGLRVGHWLAQPQQEAA